MILVVGASGFLGREATKLLLGEGQQVRAMTRTPAKVEDLRKLGAEVIQADLIDAPSLKRACQGVDRVLAAAHSMLGKGKYKSEAVDDMGYRALIDSAKAAGVAHFVYTSVQDARPDNPIDFFRTKFRVEEYLKASGISNTILRPSGFMEWQVHIFNGKSILEKGKTSLIGTGNKPRNFIAVHDVAQFAVQALMDPKLKNRTIDIGGPQNLTNNQVAELYGKMADITPKVSHMPAGMAKVMSIVFKPFHPGLSRVMYMGSLPDDAFSEKFDPTALLSEFPRHLTTLEDFVRERVAEAKSLSA